MDCNRAVKRQLRNALLLFSVIGLAAAPVRAQSAAATLQGTVSDEQGAILPGASITITNVDTGLTRPIVSDSRGWYHAAAQ